MHAQPPSAAAAAGGPGARRAGWRRAARRRLGAVGLVAKLRAVLRVRDFRRLWLSMSLSSFGDWLGLLAITATATSLVNGFAAANFALGGVLLFRLLPAIVLGPLAGVFADRFDRRKTMVVCDLIRFVLFASIPLVDNLIWLFVAQFLIEAFTPVLDPGQGGRGPEHAAQGPAGAGQPAHPGHHLRPHPGARRDRASRLLTTRRRPAVRRQPRRRPGRPGALPQRADLPGRRVRHLEPALDQRPPRRRPGRSGRRRFFGSLKHGLAFVGHTPLVRGLVLGIFGAFAAAGVVIATGQVFADSLGGGDAAYGLLFGAVFVGLGLGIALRPEHRPRPGPRAALRRGIVGAGVMVLLMALDVHLWIALLLVVLVGFFAGIAYLAGTTLLGTEVDDEIRGRTFAIVQSLVRAALILSLAVVPFGVGPVGQPPGRPRRRHGPDHRRADLLLVAGLLALGVGMRGLPADGRRPAGPAARRPRHRAAPRHHRPAPAGRRRGVHRLRGRRGRRQVHPGRAGCRSG